MRCFWANAANFILAGPIDVPAIEHAGLRRFRFHHLRHTFGSLLIQGGASITYVKEQMGHSSIQVTVDTYAHLIPGPTSHG